MRQRTLSWAARTAGPKRGRGGAQPCAHRGGKGRVRGRGTGAASRTRRAETATGESVRHEGSLAGASP